MEGRSFFSFLYFCRSGSWVRGGEGSIRGLSLVFGIVPPRVFGGREERKGSFSVFVFL